MSTPSFFSTHNQGIPEAGLSSKISEPHKLHEGQQFYAYQDDRVVILIYLIHIQGLYCLEEDFGNQDEHFDATALQQIPELAAVPRQRTVERWALVSTAGFQEEKSRSTQDQLIETSMDGQCFIYKS
ncbi:Soluble Scavenger Receptor Cysteine-Rich Domain-Containing Protein Ssc5D [Manis pentadactyla]|nr:Soluble Scavenger Receptor Cysteine-Rich Domain-Containing Protein Ssc5D [Manis pentadactyla]